MITNLHRHRQSSLRKRGEPSLLPPLFLIEKIQLNQTQMPTYLKDCNVTTTRVHDLIVLPSTYDVANGLEDSC